ncbi:hypothetical protein [Oceanicaulis sp.]|uniref:hypothetical protein n=1 Tax=Oceanicaulis sp. TaxID=1924941 RepID=UPI003D28F0E4
MSDLTPTEQTRVLDAYQAARESMDHGAAAIHVITTTQLPQGAVRAVIAAYRHDIGEIEA